MTTCDDTGREAAKAIVARRRSRRDPALTRWPRAGFCLAAILLAGCGLTEGAGSILVDPGRYTIYHCNDLAARWKILIARETQLRGLMDKANEGAGGALIGSLAYRTDYESVLTDEKLLQRTAVDKDCSFIAEFQSDRTIR